MKAPEAAVKEIGKFGIMKGEVEVIALFKEKGGVVASDDEAIRKTQLYLDYSS